MLGFDSIAPPINIEDSMPINGNMYPLYPQRMAVPLLPENDTYFSAAGRTSQKVPTSYEWENHRAEITRLYRDEKKTLEEVMITMRQRYDFKATRKMYKTRISKWDIRRNLRWSEREDACRVVKQRLFTSEKGSKVVIRGQERDISLLRRHMRHPKSRVMSQVLTAEVQAVNNAVVTRSPQRYRSPSHVICQDFMEQGIQRNLYPTDNQREVESICLNVAYFCGTLTDLTSLRASSKLYIYFYQAGKWLSLGDYKQARLLFSQALDIFRATVLANPFEMLFGWLQVFATCRFKRDKWHFFDQAARNAYDLSLVMCGANHPIAMVLSHMSRNPDGLSAIATIAFQAAITSLERRNKPMHTFRQISWLRRRLILVWSRTGSLSSARALLMLNFEDCERFETSKRGRAHVMLVLARHYLDNEWSSPAKFHDVLKASCRTKDEESWDVGIRLRVNRLQARAALKVGNDTEAERLYRASSSLAMQSYGQSSSKHTEMAFNLASVLRKQGKHAEAEHEMNMCRLTDDMENRMHI